MYVGACNAGVACETPLMPTLLQMATHEFGRHRAMAEVAMAVLDDEQFFRRPSPRVNPVALVVKHLAGNLHSRWREFLTTDGEKPDRNRDREFVIEASDTRVSLEEAWARGWATLVASLRELRDGDLDRTITIRGEPHTAAQAIFRGSTHVAYHVGQILYLSRMLAPDAPWITVPPGGSSVVAGVYLASPPPPGAVGAVGEAVAAVAASPATGSPPSAASHAPRIRRVLETALYCDDLDRATAFYSDVLGLRVMQRSERMASIDAGSSSVLLLFLRGASRGGIATDGGMIPPHDGSGPWHLTFAVDGASLDEWTRRFTDHGVGIEARVSWPRGGRSLYVRDPDGHSVELATPGVWDNY